MVKSTNYKHFLIILWLYGLFNVLKTLYGTVILWFEHFLNFWAEICQIFWCFFGKFKKSKRHSEIIWPLVHTYKIEHFFHFLWRMSAKFKNVWWFFTSLGKRKFDIISFLPEPFIWGLMPHLCTVGGSLLKR